MKIALIGGTHGNEPIGREVMEIFRRSKKKYRNQFKTFLGNPKANELKKRYVDSDLNRSFGKNKKSCGYEDQRSQELTVEIKSNFDFSIDLHTTTSNMGQTIILNNTHKNSKRVAAAIKKIIPSFKIIEEDKLNEECNHLNRLCPAGVTVELGPVANNVIEFDLLAKMHKIVEFILDFDFEQEIDLTNVEYFKMLGQINYPDAPNWYIHFNIDRHDFLPIVPNQPIFIKIDGETKLYEGVSEIYPFFINEAAYLENKSAFLYAQKMRGL